mmetsp:Transcript_78387/g.108501  ORF Transcript_78387/g.108501 Transcript_78387/m.108501 type:complete len:228 (+) Transcript_78387:19-702(+)
MAYRTVFKIAGSLGPGGSIAILTEKVCRQTFYDAYEQGDPTRVLIEEQDTLMQNQRSAYVTELFELKSNFERKSQSLNQATKDEGYVELANIIIKHRNIMVKTEKGRLIRERIFYKDDPNRYQRCLDQAAHVEEDVLDNLVKMAIHINKPDTQLLNDALEAQGVSAPRNDVEEGDIETRVTEDKANEYLQKWKRILVRNEAVLEGAANQSTTLLEGTGNENLEKCKD